MRDQKALYTQGTMFVKKASLKQASIIADKNLSTKDRPIEGPGCNLLGGLDMTCPFRLGKDSGTKSPADSESDRDRAILRLRRQSRGKSKTILTVPTKRILAVLVAL
jgi:hypothetical protein